MTDGIVPTGGGGRPTSASLLVSVQAMDPDGWRRLVHVYGPLVYRWCRRAGLQEVDAADVGQEVFRSVARTVGGFRRDGRAGAFRGWLKTITRNKVCDFARARQNRIAAAGGSEALGRLEQVPAESALDHDDPADAQLALRRAVDLALADLKEVNRRAFLAVAVDGRDPADVARELGISVNAVYLAKSRIKRRLRDEFADLLDL